MTDSILMTPQEQRELAQALAVQRMNAEQRSEWLRVEWATATANAQLFMSRFPSQPGAISFASLAEKNHHDEQRELRQAAQYSLTATSRHAPISD